MIEHLFGSKTRVKLLQIFFTYPDKNFYVRELSRLAGTQLNAVRREIRNLEKIGLLGQATASEKGMRGERSKFYSLREDCLLYPELRELMTKVRVMEQSQLVEEIKKRAGRIKLFLLTGLFTDEPEAETDLLLVGQFRPLVIARLVKEFEKVVSREIRYTLMEEKEFNERRQVGDKFIYGLFESEHIVAVDEFGLN